MDKLREVDTPALDYASEFEREGDARSTPCSNHKMNAIRLEADSAQEQASQLAARVKVLEQENLTKEQEIVSLTHRNTLFEADVEKLEKALADAKAAADTGATNSAELDTLTRKVQLLEEEVEEADKNLRETNEKLRLTDVKAEHYERKVATVEAERDGWEKKYEETLEKYKKSQDELERFARELEGI